LKIIPMKFPKHCVLAVTLSLAMAGRAGAGTVVDRVVADVNGNVLLQSDWDDEVTFEAFVDGRTPDSFTPDERKAALDRLIDQELLREQVRPAQEAPTEQVAARLAEVRKSLPQYSTEEGWHAALQRYGLTQSALEKRLSDELQLMKLVEDRLRPSIQIDQKAVESYYHNEFVPQLKKAGAKAKPLTEVYTRIKELLAQKKMNELLVGWLSNLRSGGHITTPDSGAGEENR
jgi:peptidyl-prolyl cis-trans isomerase SurA